MPGYQKNVANQVILFDMRNSSGVLQTGKVVTGTVSKDGGAQGAVAGTITEVTSGGGMYKLVGAATDLNADYLGFKFSNAECQDTMVYISTESDITPTRAAFLDASIASRMATFALPTNFASLLVTDAGKVTAGTVDDKTGYALSVTPLAASSYVAPDNSGIAAISIGVGQALAALAQVTAKTDNLPASPAAVGSAMTLAAGSIQAATFAAGAITAAVIASNAFDADALSTDAISEIVAAIMAQVVEANPDGGNINLLQAVKVVLDTCVAKSLNMQGGGDATIRDLADTKNRVVVPLSSVGNRGVPTFDLT